MTLLHEDRALLAKLRADCLRTAPQVTWTVAGEKLLDVYWQIINEFDARTATPTGSPNRDSSASAR